MSEFLRNLARSRFTNSEFSHSSGKGMLIGEMVSPSTPPDKDESDYIFSVGDTATEKQATDTVMETDEFNNAGYNTANLSDTGTDIIMQLFNNTSNSTFQDSTEANFNFSDIFGCDIFNESCIFSNLSSVNSTESAPHGPGDYAFWSCLLLIFPLFTVFGNVLVVLSIYRERTLRHVTNYFICSLAIADIMVAVVVMPPAVYLEVTKYWGLSDLLCDAWVAFDVLACTASILNLTAISVDRFIAVTQPIKYAKHKNSKRVQVMLGLTWVVSIAIAAPIALGVNYSDVRSPGDCTFFNSDFLIYSSMGSFYIPSLIMIFLYWRIYRVLRLRARKSLANKKARNIDTQTLTNVIENTANTQNTQYAVKLIEEPTVLTGFAKIDNGKVSTYNTNNCKAGVGDEASTSNPTNSDSHEKEESESKCPDQNESKGEFIVNPAAEDAERQEMLSAYKNPPVAMETNFSQISNQISPDNDSRSSGKQTSSDGKDRRKKDKKNVTKFNFHMRTSRKRKERSSSKRERKATKTLAIVLGVFLLCWWPFFTVNIMRAICLRYEVLNYPKCDIDVNLMAFFVWLGYINSFLNPVIYTIFNPEFRKAFKKILTECCKICDCCS